MKEKIFYMYKLPIHLIRQYLFCPRVVYFLEVLSIPKESPIWVKEGENYHKSQEKLFKRRTLSRFNLENADFWQNVNLSYSDLNFYGICDALIISDTNIYPVEIKLHGQKPTKAQKMQVIAYGILAEKKYKKEFNLAFISFEKNVKTVPINVDIKMKQDVQKTVNEIINLIKSEKLPYSNAEDEKCTQCEFLNYCNDRF
ncbi:CRISPR-associated protein Cas4 [Aliarcobacter cryaerophilus]|uniref:CRISPR-associated protein Cas4 n=1 Tax=Aliarcobacter cryaerophilus TaxID=28198 RepID=UPI003AF3B721